MSSRHVLFMSHKQGNRKRTQAGFKKERPQSLVFEHINAIGVGKARLSCGVFLMATQADQRPKLGT